MIKSLIKKHRFFLMIFFLALVLRGIAFYASSPVVIVLDSAYYQELALRLIHNHTFEDTFRVPGYPIFVAGIYYVFGANPSIVSVVLQ